MNHEKPIKSSYCIIPGRFLAGEYPGSHDPAIAKTKLKALIDAGVTSFIDLTEPEEALEPYAYLIEDLSEKPISVRRFPITDFSVPKSEDFTVEILDHIDRSMSQGGVVYLHCRGGVGRTGTIVGCWLARHGQKGQAALERLREVRSQCLKSQTRQTPETDAQTRYVLEWDE